MSIGRLAPLAAGAHQKLRSSTHSIDMCEYKITSKGVVMGEPLRGYSAPTSGIPWPWSTELGQNAPDVHIAPLSMRLKPSGEPKRHS